MKNKTIIIFLILGVVFGIILSTVHHFTTNKPEPEKINLSIDLDSWDKEEKTNEIIQWAEWEIEK